MQAHGGDREKPFVLKIERVRDQDRGISFEEHSDILGATSDLDSSNFSLITLRNRNKLGDVLQGEKVTPPQMRSLLEAEDDIDHLIRLDKQDIIEIDPELKAELDQNKEIKITCLDLSDSEIGEGLVYVVAKKLLPQLPHLTHLVLRNCKIGAESAKALVKVLEENQELLKRLQWVDLSQNRLDMSAILELKRVLTRNKNSQINKSSFVNAIEGSLLKKTKEKALVLSGNKSYKFDEEVLKAAEALIEEFKTRKLFNQNNEEALVLFDEAVLEAIKNLVTKSKMGELVVEKRGNNEVLLRLNGDIMNLVGPLLELTEKCTFIISEQQVDRERVYSEIILLKNLEKWERAGCLKELDLVTNFESGLLLTARDSERSEFGMQISEKVANRIKNIAIKFSIICLKLNGNGQRNFTIINLTKELLKESPSLKELYVNAAGIGNSGAEEIAGALRENQFLEVLNLSGNEIRNEGSKAFAKVFQENKNTSLMKLDLSHNEICSIKEWIDCGLKELSLIKLNFDYNEIGDEEKDLLQSLLEEVVSLDLQKFEREIKKIKEKIKSGTVLTGVQIIYSQLGNRGVKELASVLQECTSLTSLDLHGNKIGNEGVEILVKLIKENVNLQRLDLSNNQIGDKWTGALAMALKGHVLEKLDLSDNQIGNKGVVNFAGLLELPDLQDLNLSNNQIGDEGAIAFTLVLEKLPNLQELNLSSNQIGYLGIESLAKVIKLHKFLVTLLLFKNQIGDEGAKALAKALNGSSNLEKLELGSNQIGNVGAVEISNELGNNNASLKHLSLRRNQIRDEGAAALVKVFSQSKRVKLNLRNNPIENEENIKKIWKEHQFFRLLSIGKSD